MGFSNGYVCSSLTLTSAVYWRFKTMLSSISRIHHAFYSTRDCTFSNGSLFRAKFSFIELRYTWSPFQRCTLQPSSALLNRLDLFALSLPEQIDQFVGVKIFDRQNVLQVQGWHSCWYDMSTSVVLIFERSIGFRKAFGILVSVLIRQTTGTTQEQK